MSGTKPAKQVPQQWQHAVAGCSAGMASVLVLHPLDVIKTRLQVQDGAGALPLYRGTLDAVRNIVKQEGWRALYSGLTPALIGSTVAWGAYFFSYNRAKERYLRRAAFRQAQQTQQAASPPGKLSPAMHLISAAEAGAVVCFLTNPIWVVKTRLQLQRAAGPGSAARAGAARAAAGGGQQYRGFVDALVQITRQEGVRGLYRGLLPSLLLVSHGAIQLAVYEELKTLAQSMPSLAQGRLPAPLSSASPSTAAASRREGGGSPTEGGGGSGAQRVLSSAEITACGALSKLAASVATYPSQVVRARLQQRMDAGRAVQYSGVLDVLLKTVAREGVGGLYKGLAPNVLRVMPQSALTFLVYESVMRYLREREGGE